MFAVKGFRLPGRSGTKFSATNTFTEPTATSQVKTLNEG